jgi:hypothetical protein
MANLRSRKSPEQRIRGYKAEFRKTSKDGVFYERGIPPRHAKFFTFDNRDKDNVILRSGFTPRDGIGCNRGRTHLQTRSRCPSSTEEPEYR